ncbi:hypothetical protein [Sphingomonas sp. CFBP 8760]|uniref:hypothetical protein n=1 Tax=Sphingomonas sp. CFBP 8760 TaxID=2775282 RepID=UPI001785F9FD|nr:hypothetical protein [Sphingomonas sp. CFBP 8760]MBD8547941.1 hypothetical protein [Sphingomonas sp. CFBP 8760]
MRLKQITAAILPLTGFSASPLAAQSVTLSPAPEWTTCAAEDAICDAPANGLIRYGAGKKFVYRIAPGPVPCNNATFGDPILGTAKTCAVAIPAGSTVPAHRALSATSSLAPAPITDPRARLGINLAPTIYWSGEQSFANQMLGAEWRLPAQGWGYASGAMVKDGEPVEVKPGSPMIAFLTPPAAAATSDAAETRCTWKGKGRVSVSGPRRDTSRKGNSLSFVWPRNIPQKQTVQFEVQESVVSDPIRSIDCRLTTDAPDAIYAPQLLAYLKPFGVLRFLDWSSANGNPAAVTWATRGKPAGLSIGGSDGVALEYQIGLTNAVGASPWFTVPLNADADYQQRMAQMVHDQVPAGRPVYVELSNEVWNYQFGQAHQLQKEGVAAKLSDNAFQSAQYRYAQRVIDLMAVWSKVYADRPRDLVRVVATQAGNPWVGEILMDWNGGKLRGSVDAIAIAPYFTVDLAAGGDMVARLADASRSQIAREATAYAALAKRTGKRLIGYEGGQHLIDPARLDTMVAANRDPRMERIYSDYLAGWSKVSGGDLLTLYSATGSISGHGAWGLREYAGQPLSETPKLRGVLH